MFEQSEELREAGAGLTLHANSLAALNHIEPALLKAVRKHALEVEVLQLADQRGKTLSTLTKKQLVDRFGYPTILVHRGELLHSLVDFTESMKNGPEIVTGSRVVDVHFDPNEEAMTVILADGSQEKAGILIGADGLHSVIREQLHGNFSVSTGRRFTDLAMIRLKPMHNNCHLQARRLHTMTAAISWLLYHGCYIMAKAFCICRIVSANLVSVSGHWQLKANLIPRLPPQKAWKLGQESQA